MFNVESERVILTAVLNKPELLTGALLNIEVEHFTAKENKEIFKAIKKLHGLSQPIDVITVSSLLEEEERLSIIGGRAFVNDLALDYEPSMILTIPFHVDILEKNFTLRQIHKLAKEVMKRAESGDNPDEVVADYMSRLHSVALRGTEIEGINLLENPGFMTDILDKEEEEPSEVFYTLFPQLDSKIVICKGDLVVIGADTSMGKALKMDCNILTPSGWRLNKDIKLGDEVVGQDGLPTKVIGVYPQGVTNNYEIEFMDGRKVQCCENHQWSVGYSKWKDNRVIKTKDLATLISQPSKKGRLHIPMYKETDREDVSVPLAPYLLGVHIGGGCITRSGLTVYFCPDGQMVRIPKSSEIIGYIKSVGLNTQSCNKFIPPEYFRCSRKQRMELLRGLLDTDGYKYGKGYEYSTTSKRLAFDVQQLAWSLGLRCKMLTRMGKYRKGGSITETRYNYRLFISGHKPNLTIKSITPCGAAETQCLMVDNYNHLFVIEDYLITHNSVFCNCLAVSAHHQNIPVTLFSLEMKASEQLNRLYSNVCDIGIEKFRRKSFTQNERETITKATRDVFDKFDITIYDRPGIDTDYVYQKLLIEKKKRGRLGLVIIDHIQFMRGQGRTEKEQLTQIAERLKCIAMELDCYMVMASQLKRRELRNKEGDTYIPRPTLHDFKESGDIENAANIAILLYRQDREAINAEINIAKNRDGEIGVIFLDFFGKYCKFSSKKKPNS